MQVKYKIKKPAGMKDSNAFTLYEDSIPCTPLCFGSYEAAFNFFRKHFDLDAEVEKQTKQSLGKYSNTGYLNLIDMGEGEE
jgi:hypothetical protein